MLCGSRGIRDRVPRGVRGYISVMAALKFTHLLIERNTVLLKINAELLYS